jgi:hypothetical protein
MTSAIRPLLATYGKPEGICNICGEFAKLTLDHTPPKGVLRLPHVELHHMMDRLAPELPKRKGRAFQNGVMYRTLCQRCNNELGLDCDPALIAFANAVSEALQSGALVGKLTCDAAAVMRAVVGHLSAVGVDRYLKGPNTEPIAAYMANRALPLPDPLQIFWWPFPFQGQVMMRDAVYSHGGSEEPIFFWLLKFYPLAFLVTFDRTEASPKFQLPELSELRHLAQGTLTELSIGLSAIVHPFWPEAPSRDHFIAVGRDAMTAQQFQRRGKDAVEQSDAIWHGSSTPLVTGS